MRYDLAYRNDIVYVRVHDEINLTTDITPLYDIIREQIGRRETKFAVSFPDSSFFYSQHLAVLLKCLERVREAQGSLTVLRPSGELSDALLYIDPGHFVRRVHDTAELTASLAMA